MRSPLKKLRIAIDLDGVIVDLVGAMLPKLRELKGKPVSKSDISVFDIGQALSIDETTMKSFWQWAEKEGLYASAPAVQASLQNIAYLADHDVWIVTSRPPSVSSQTKDWLVRNGIPFSRLLFRKRMKKVSRRDRVDVFIEDDPESALYVAPKGVSVFIYNQPWNQNIVMPANCLRVFDWPQIVEIVKSIRST